MYPGDELKRLALRKTALQTAIGSRRAQCLATAGDVLRPVKWVDRLLAVWDRISPLVKLSALPLGFILQRTSSRALAPLRSLTRWIPVVAALRALTTRFKRPSRSDAVHRVSAKPRQVHRAPPPASRIPMTPASRG
jgi:hypothetical protein